MKAKKFFAVVAIAMVSVVGLCSFTHNSVTVDLNPVNVSTEVAVQGKHCSGTVGCDCPGFAPITNQEVWKQGYCKHCGHKKGCHR